MTAYLDWLGRYLPDLFSESPPNAVDGSTLVMGAAAGYTPLQVKPFIESLRRYYRGPVTVIVADTDRDLATYLEGNGVHALMPQQELGMAGPFGSEIHIARYAYYIAWLARCDPMPSRVLLSDVRDVIIQDDPFSERSAAALHYYVEQDARLGNHATRRWIADAIGDAMATALADRPCICSGIMLGSGAAIQQLCRAVLFLAAIPRRGVARSFGIDQAAVNIAAHCGLSPGDIHQNLGHVATLGIMQRGSLRVDDAGFVVNPDGSRSAMVHQYDRHPDLLAAIQRHYGAAQQVASSSSVRKTVTRLQDGFRRRVPEVR
jgi:hypothetical protein